MIDYDAADVLINHVQARIVAIIPFALNSDQNKRLRGELIGTFSAGLTAAEGTERDELTRDIMYRALKLYAHELRKDARRIRWVGDEHQPVRVLMRRRARLAENMARLHWPNSRN